jgi:predicted porin
MTGTSPQRWSRRTHLNPGLCPQGLSPGWLALVLVALLGALPAAAQQKTGPGVPADESLTWHGITLYGVVDIGIQYDTHMAPFTPFRPAASGNIVRQNSHSSPVGLTPSNMGQSRVGLAGVEPLVSDWAAVFQIETFFNPQSGEVANSVKSLTVNNGVPLNKQSVGVDGSSAGQAFQTSFVGVRSKRFGALTFGRQVTLLSEGMITYDPNYLSTAFGLLGASNTYAGGGSNEDNRLDSTVKYLLDFDERLHVGGLYKFNGAGGSGRTAVQANLGTGFAGASVDAFYSQVKSSITSSALSVTQAQDLINNCNTAATATPAPKVVPCYSMNTALFGTVSDNTSYALMGSYKFSQVKLFAGYQYIKYEDPATPLSAGFVNVGGYVLAFVNNTAYKNPKISQVYWTGVRYAVIPHLELTAAYYGVHQSAYGSGTQAGCSTNAHNVCSGSLEAFSFDADYRFNVHFDVYAGAMYSGVHDGLAAGYLNTTNINPTIGVRYKF